MHTVGAAGECNVSSRVDQEASCQLPVLSSQLGLAEHADGRASESFQFAGGKIFLAQLNEIHAAASGFSNLLKQSVAAGVFVPGKLGTIGDVVKEQFC